MNPVIGKRVKVTVDRPLGSAHPKYPDLIYPINYGYIEGILGGDGEEQDAYLLGVNEPMTTFEGVVIAILRRKNDCEDKWIVAPCDNCFTDEEILAATHFQEQYFDTELIRD